MPTFKTEAERLRQAQAKLISFSMWYDNNLFCQSLSDAVLRLMKRKQLELLDEVIPQSADNWARRQAWLGIALTQPELSLAQLQEVAKQLEINTEDLLLLFVVLGNTRLLDEFTATMDPVTLKSMVEAKEFYLYKKCAEHGHVAILTRLEAWSPKAVNAMATAGNYYAYKYAASNGHVPVLKHLENKVPEQKTSMVAAEHFVAFKLAASQEKIAVLEHFATSYPEMLAEMISMNNFAVLHYSVTNQQTSVSFWLLSNSIECFEHAVAYQNKIINSFIDYYLATLHHTELNTSDKSVLDVKDHQQLKLHVQIVKYLIRLNDNGLNNEVPFLLNIPAIKSLMNIESASGLAKELLQLALTVGNREAALILLKIPEVYKLAKHNPSAIANSQSKLDLQQLVQSQETSDVNCPQEQVLTYDQLSKAIKNFASEHFYAEIGQQDMNLLHTTYNNYVVNKSKNKAPGKLPLASLNIPSQKIQEFEAFLAKQYGTQYTQSPFFCQHVFNSFKLDKNSIFQQSHASQLLGVQKVYDLMGQFLATQAASANQSAAASSSNSR